MKNRTKNMFYIGNILLFICAMICLICYDLYGGLRLKGVTSSWFVALGLFNLLYAGMKKKISSFLILMELGLSLGMCADVLLGIQFILGILFFASGHICYLLAFCTLEKPCRKDLIITVPLAALSMFIVVGTPFIQIEDLFLKRLLLGYAVIIACMLGKAISNWSSKKCMYRLLILLGSTMFWFSDVMLAVDLFGEGNRLTWRLCSYTYWPAQNILALSLYFFINGYVTKRDKLEQA